MATLKLTEDNGSVRVFSEVITPAPVPPPPSPAPAPVQTSIYRGGFFDGIPDQSVIQYATQFGMSWNRLWFGVSDWTKPPASNDPTLIRCRLMKAQGIKVLLVVTPTQGATLSPVPLPTDTTMVFDYFSAFADAANGAVDAFEVLNEPNLAVYNSGYTALANTVKFIQAPAYRALHGAGQFVVVGAPQEGATNLPYMISNGILSCGDAIAYHPYGASVAEQVARVQNVYNLIQNKPLWITEWNFHGDSNNPAAWAAMLNPGALSIRSMLAAVFYFRMMRTTQAAGPAAPFYNDSGSIIQSAAFHDAALAAMQSF